MRSPPTRTQQQLVLWDPAHAALTQAALRPPPRCTTIVLATPPLSLGESRKPDPCVSLPYSIRCSTIVLATPPRPDGTITPEVLYCAKKAGVTHILKAGGAQV